MKHLPKRKNKVYKAIENFKDFELTNCIAYEMAIRNDKNIELINLFTKEYLNKINTEDIPFISSTDDFIEQDSIYYNKYAITLGYADKNPFDNILKDLIIPKANVTHYAKITETDELKELINSIYSYNGHYSTVNSLKLGLHLPLRASNLTNLLW